MPLGGQVRGFIPGRENERDAARNECLRHRENFLTSQTYVKQRAVDLFGFDQLKCRADRCYWAKRYLNVCNVGESCRTFCARLVGSHSYPHASGRREECGHALSEEPSNYASKNIARACGR